jgi:hypothetical protein
LNPVIIIPTYVGTKRKTPSYNVVATYDHVTPVTHQGELPRCLASLRDNGVNVPVVLLVAAESGVEREASAKIRETAAAYNEVLDIRVVDAGVLSHFHLRVEQLGLAAVKEGVSLTGYGAIRNLGLVVAATLGFTEVIFIDDDEVVGSPDFLEQSLYGLGKLSKKGVPVLVKSGYYTDRKGQWKSKQKNAWYNRYWEQGELFNKWITKAMNGLRLSRSNILYGGLFAVHREAYRRVSFDPWIPRGEDLDYLLNIRMYGGGVWFDNQWSIQHLPPTERNEAQRFKQDIYRWTYEHRKLEFSKTQIDLLQIQPHSLDPYPGPFLENSVTTRVFTTALLRTIGTSQDRKGYLRAAQVSRREAKAYAEMFCSKYFEFQLGWAQTLATLESDPQLKSLFMEATRVSSVAGIDQLSEAERGYAADREQDLQQTYQQSSPLGQTSFGVPDNSAAALQNAAVSATAGMAQPGSPLSVSAQGVGVPPQGPKPDLLDFELDFEALGIDIDDD